MVEVAQYSIARFRPFPETGEFANIGIIAVRGTDVSFKVVPRRYRRVTQFFNSLDPALFARTVDLVTCEFEFFRDFAVRTSREALRTLTMRNEETTILFSEIRTVLVGESLDETADKLYSRYIGRNFANADYSEQIIARNLRKILKQNGINNYKEQVVDDGVLQVKFPHVSHVNGTWVIKPIALTQRTPLGVLDHAAMWRDRLEFLLRRGALDRNKILIPLAGHHTYGDAETANHEAYDAAVEGLRALDVNVIDPLDSSALLAFARMGAEPHQRWLYQ